MRAPCFRPQARYDLSMTWNNVERSRYDHSWYELTDFSGADIEAWNRIERVDREREVLDFLDTWQERGGVVTLPDDAAFQELVGVYEYTYKNELGRPADELLYEACQRCNVI